MSDAPRSPPAGPALLLAPILLGLSLSSYGEEKGSLGAHREGHRLTLNLDVGMDFTFRATDEVEKRTTDYRMVVQKVGAKGDVTLAVVGFVQRAGEENPPSRANAQGAILTLSTDGRVKRIAGRRPAVPRAFESHLRLIFGSGLRRLPLEERHLYRLEPLLASTEGARRIRLSFEGFVAEKDRKLARFSVLEHPGLARRGPANESVPGPPPAPGHLRVVGVSVQAAPPAGAKARVSLEKWVVAGEVTYRTEDGLLEAARVEGRLPTSSETVKLSIRRITASHAEKTLSERP